MSSRMSPRNHAIISCFFCVLKESLIPYLFILCAEALSFLITKAVQNQSLHGVKIYPVAPSISHLLFADDNIIFTRSTHEEACQIDHLLQVYEQAFGQRINLDKSELTFNRNVPSIRTNQLAMLLGVKLAVAHGKYLGLPSLIGRSKTQVF